MFARSFGTAALAAAQIVIPLGHPRVIEPPKAPIETAGPLWVSRCNGSDDDTKAAPPVRIHANSYLVGTCGSASVLIVGDEGDILIDSGPDAAASVIADNLAELGVGPRDLRFILHTSVDPSHAGGIGKLQEMTGATLVSTAPAARLFQIPRGDDQASRTGTLNEAPYARVGRIISDGGELRLGNLMLTAMVTPASPTGAMSWRWTSCDGGVCRALVFASSVAPTSIVSRTHADPSAELAAYRAWIDRFAAMPCEILLTDNPAASEMPKRLALGEPLYDPDACKAFAAKLSRELDEHATGPAH